jgi:hypothetical protein
MRLIFSNVIFDTQKSEKIGTIPLESGVHHQTLYRTPRNRYFFLIEELDMHPVHRRIVPTTAATARVWLNANQHIINRPKEKAKDPLVTTFLSPGDDSNYQIPDPVSLCLAIPFKP